MYMQSEEEMQLVEKLVAMISGDTITCINREINPNNQTQSVKRVNDTLGYEIDFAELTRLKQLYTEWQEAAEPFKKEEGIDIATISQSEAAKKAGEIYYHELDKLVKTVLEKKQTLNQ